MNSNNTSLISLIIKPIILILITLIILFSTLKSLTHQHPQDTFRGLNIEEKTRLGSTPPSCHNKCNQCHPCMAVQVPPLPSHSRVNPSLSQTKHPEDDFDSSSNRYSNYKPLGWKCRCDGHFYNP